MYYLLLYDVVEDFIRRRAPFRDTHLALAERAREQGELLLAGAVGDPPDGAALVFETEDPSVAERFAQGDPYVQAGLVTRWTVKPWHIVVGGGAATGGAITRPG